METGNSPEEESANTTEGESSEETSESETTGSAEEATDSSEMPGDKPNSSREKSTAEGSSKNSLARKAKKLAQIKVKTKMGRIQSGKYGRKGNCSGKRKREGSGKVGNISGKDCEGGEQRYLGSQSSQEPESSVAVLLALFAMTLVPKTLIISVLAIATAALAWPYVVELSLFSGHPIGMGLFITLSTAAVAVLQQSEGESIVAAERKKKSDLHGILQAAAIVSAFSGFGFIAANKNAIDHAHFESYHSIGGGTLLLTLLVVGGFGALVKLGAISRKYLNYHRYFGRVTLLWAVLVASVGLTFYHKPETHVGQLIAGAYIFCVSAVLFNSSRSSVSTEARPLLETANDETQTF
ncbi:hypothetical protein HDU82_001603 [Entophlyctis luteolus]|nr:hypothetical protein HDU82_001603 [Entophlyctis luteolus]